MAESNSSKWTRRTKRPITAREAAERFGISIRTVQRAWAMPREEWLRENHLSRTQPWERLGMSRATWYRHGKPMPEEVGPERGKDGTAADE